MRALTAIALLLVAATVAGQNAQDNYDRVLLPIYLDRPVPGAFGSVWASEFAVHNASPFAVFIEWCSPPAEFPMCFAIGYSDATLEPGETHTFLPRAYVAPSPGVPGRVVYFEASPTAPGGAVPDLAWQLRVGDVSRSDLSAGTELPVVHRSSFRTRTTRLLNVPVEPKFRWTLRIYEMNLDASSFAIRAYDQATGGLVGESVRTVSTRKIQGPGRFEPAYLELPASEVAPNAASPSRVRIEIEPLTAGVEFWGYVSIINNQTQQLTIVTPQ